MPTLPRLEVPEPLELLEFFAAEPTARDDGVTVFETSDESGARLRFSFNVFEGSIQTVLSVRGANVATVSREGARRMWIDADGLHATFTETGFRTELHIRLGQTIQVMWSSLRTE